MFGRRRVSATLAGAAAAMAIGASAASASTFYVNGTTGSDANPCTSTSAPCKTIDAAIADSELVPGTATIHVAAGTYQERVEATGPADDGIAIEGAGSGAGGTEIEGPAKSEEKPTVQLAAPGNSATLSDVSVVNEASEDTGAGIAAVGETTLDDVAVDMRNAGPGHGVESSEFGGSFTMRGGSVTLAKGTTGAAIALGFAPAAVEGVSVTLENGSTGIGIEDDFAHLSLANTTFTLGNTAGPGIATEWGPVSASDVTVTQGSEENKATIELGLSSMSLDDVHIEMTGAKSTGAAIETVFGNGVFEDVEVGGAWQGPALFDEDSELTLRDSRLVASATSKSPAVLDESLGEGAGLFVQRSVLQAATKAEPAALLLGNANATLDSSELLGGDSGALLIQEAGKTRTLTVAASTIDAGVLGARDAPPVYGIVVESAGSKHSAADVNVEGSIVLERQSALVGAAGDTASVTCSNSDVPSQTQAASATEGSIACASGASGNDETNPLTALFQAPGSNYELNPASADIDSVPSGAITLPFGLTPSSTDLVGNPRSEGVDCVTLQDKGALELPGRGTPCPPPPTEETHPSAPKPQAGVITGLTISPDAFYAAPSGATISKAKRKYGATVSYHDSQVATTTFTVLAVSSGRRQGKSCKKPSKANVHGKRCTILTARGSFVHVDDVGANSLRFSGRLHGKKLTPGAYRLQAVAHDAAGNGPAGDKSFTIK